AAKLAGYSPKPDPGWAAAHGRWHREYRRLPVCPPVDRACSPTFSTHRSRVRVDWTDDRPNWSLLGEITENHRVRVQGTSWVTEFASPESWRVPNYRRQLGQPGWIAHSGSQLVGLHQSDRHRAETCCGVAEASRPDRQKRANHRHWISFSSRPS